MGAGNWIVGILIIGALAFGGYRYYTEKTALDEIETSISGVGIPSVGLTEASFPITMSFENPSKFSSPPFTLNYDVLVGGSTVATGSTSVGPISPGSTKTSEFTVSVSYEDVSVAVWNSISEGSFTVTVSGTLEAKAVFGLIPISRSFSETYSL